MRVSVRSIDFSSRVRLVAPAVSDTRTVFSFASLRAEGDQLAIEATNGDLTISAAMPADIVEPGEVLLPARLLIDLAGSLVEDHISFSVREGSGWAKIASGSLEARLRSGEIASWPRIGLTERQGCKLDADELAAISRILFAASSDLTHPVLTGVNVARGHVVATDRFRIARTSIAEDCPEITVPALTMREVTRRSSGGCLLEADGSRARFTAQAASWTTRVVDGKYPDTNRFFDPSGRRVLRFDRIALLQAASATEIAREEGGVVHISKQGSASRRIWARHRELGEIHQDVGADGDFEDDIAFNGKFLRDALEAIDTQEVTLEIESSADPVLIRGPRLDQVLLPRKPVSGSDDD